METRWEILADLINENSYETVAEVGVAAGGTMSKILENCPSVTRYIAVDVDLSRVRQAIGQWEPGGLQLFEMASLKAAQQIEDGTLGLVFIDADHSYESVKADILAWKPKLKSGGILSGHDYWLHSHPLPAVDGVKQAVDELFGNQIELERDTVVHRDCYVWWVIT